MSSFFFDIDTHRGLLKREKFISNKKNQEFEYFILWLESSLASSKKYSNDYLKKISQKTGKNILVNPLDQTSKPYIYDLDNPNLKKLNSKRYCESLNVKLLGQKKYSVLDFEKEEFILKPEYSFSGIGILKSSLHAEKIKKITDFSSWIVEPLFRRNLDFSTLFLSENKSFAYQTIIDSYFQFKGIRFNTLTLNDQLRGQYQKEISLIHEIIKEEVSYPFSIDSFTYFEGEKEKLRSMCEINMRKTMGFFAYQCSEFWDFPYWGFYLTSQSKKMRETNTVIKLDPGDTQFGIYLVGAQCKDELLEKEKALLL